MARAFFGAYVAILEAWLAGEIDCDVEELASMALDLFIHGAAWAHGLRLDELGYPTDPRPTLAHHRQTEVPVPGAWPGSSW